VSTNHSPSPLYCSIAVITMLSLLVAGCASLESIQSVANISKPKTSITDTQITKLSLDGADLAFKVKVDNPNPIPIKMAGLDYAILFDGQQLTEGKKREQISISANGSSEITIPLAFKFAELYDTISGLKDKKELNYEIKTSAMFDLPILGMQALPLSTQGKLPIPQIPKIALNKISVDELSFTGAKLNIQMDLTNPNVFGVDIRNLVYQLNINNQSWAKGNLSESISLKENASQSLAIPIHVNFIEIGTSAFSLLKNPKAPLNYHLTGNMLLDSTLPMLQNIKMPFDNSASITISK